MGFSAIGVVLIVVAICAIGTVGWLVYQNNKTKPTNAVGSNGSSNSQQSTPPSNPSPTVAYLDIKGWGVKVPLGETIKDAYYTFSGSNKGDDGLPSTAWLGLTSLNDSGCGITTTGPTSEATPIGSIGRVLPTDRDPVKGSLYTELYPNGITIKGYYYFYAPWQNKKCAPKDKLQSVDSAFATATKGSLSSTSTTN